MKINEVKKLYHGTNVKFDEIDLKYAKSFKDFGKGFYLTTSLAQAQRWAQKKGEKNRIAYIYEYEVGDIKLQNLKILELLSYDKSWIDFICKCRRKGFETDHDLIYDRMADNQYQQIADILREYDNKKITAADAINKIKWNNDVDQYCFKTQKALRLLGIRKIIEQHMDNEGKWIVEEKA